MSFVFPFFIICPYFACKRVKFSTVVYDMANADGGLFMSNWRTGPLDGRAIYANMRDRQPPQLRPRQQRRGLRLAIIGMTLTVLIVVVAIGVTQLTQGHDPNAPITADQATILQESLMTKDTLTWGGDAALGAPNVFVDPAHPTEVTGFEADLMAAIAARLHLHLHFIQTPWEQFPQTLNVRTVDVFADDVASSAVPGGVALFTQPYYMTTDEIVVRASDTRFASLAALAGHPVGVVAGDHAVATVQANHAIQMVTYAQVLPFEALAAGRIDAIVVSAPLARWYSTNDALKRFRILPFELSPSPVAMALSSSFTHAPALRDLLSATLATLRCDGTLSKLLTKWGLANGLQTLVTKPAQGAVCA